jgi:hypothetical protein
MYALIQDNLLVGGNVAEESLNSIQSFILFFRDTNLKAYMHPEWTCELTPKPRVKSVRQEIGDFQINVV